MADLRSSIRSVAIIGSGTMGAQIGTVAAYRGYPVRIYDAVPEALQRARVRIESDILDGIDSSGKFTGSREQALANLSYPSTLEGAVRNVDLVIEAVKEDIDIKRSVFADLARLAPDAILATNSSSIPSAEVAEYVARPERLLNMHFFAPIWVRSMLELMSCGFTDESVLESAFEFGTDIGMTTASVTGQSKGFIINRIWRAVKRESLKVIDEGVASPEDVDRLWMMFFQTSHAPFGIMDMVGLDVVRDIEWSYQRETLDPTDNPSPTLLAMIDEGKLGEKSGQGFYSHPNPMYRQADFLKGTSTDS